MVKRRRRPKAPSPSENEVLPHDILDTLNRLDVESKRARAEYRVLLQRIQALPADERSVEWLRHFSRHIESFGDQEAIVWLRSRGHDGASEIAQIVELWRSYEKNAFKDGDGGFSTFDAATGKSESFPGISIHKGTDVRTVSRFKLRDFWHGTTRQQFTIDATMLRTAEWCRIQGFQEWWERLATATWHDTLQAGVDPIPASHGLFAMVRSTLGRRLFHKTLLHVLDVLEVRTNDLPAWQVLRPTNGRPAIASHLGCVSAVAFGNAMLRDTNGPANESVEAAVRELIRFQHDSGAWPLYSEDDSPSIKTTAMALHALAVLKRPGTDESIRKGERWLRQQQQDAHWSDPGAPDAIWMTVLALDALSLASKGSDAATTLWADNASRIKPLEEASSKGEPRFSVALSFAGESRDIVEPIALALVKTLGRDRVFYDNHFKSELARPNLDKHLQNIYLNDSTLVVVFLCDNYEKKEWCGLEWRAIRDLIKHRKDDHIMFMKAGPFTVGGVLSIDGYINCADHVAEELAGFIMERLKALT